MTDYREQTLEELLEEEKKLRKERVTLRFQQGTRQLLDTSALKKNKKSLARLLTVISEKRQTA
jgi:large subunit ribosomal protein L29